MRPLFETVGNLQTGADVLRSRRYGVIEAEQRQVRRVRLRPFPKYLLLPEALFLGPWQHHRRPGDRCLVFYNQPWRFPKFLAVTYVLSARDTTLSTVRRALEVLDEIARLKGVDALLCDVVNRRISPQVLARFGWEPHCPSRWHRHYIRRFYGTYPPQPEWMARASSGGTD